MSALQPCILVLATFAAGSLALLGPVYELQDAVIDTDPSVVPPFPFSEQENYEWEGYDGWFNNPAHPEWGGAGELVASY